MCRVKKIGAKDLLKKVEGWKRLEMKFPQWFYMKKIHTEKRPQSAEQYEIWVHKEKNGVYAVYSKFN